MSMGEGIMFDTEKRDKKSMLLDAAAVVFSKDGYYKAKVEDIARHAGVGKGTVYEYFSSKKELFQEMVKGSLEEYEILIRQELDKVDRWDKKLEKLIEANFKFAEDYRNLAKVVSSDPGGLGEASKKWLINERVSMTKFVGDLISFGIKDGTFREVDPYFTSVAFLGVLGSVIGKLLFDDEPFQHDEVKNKLMDIFLNGIRF